MQYNTCPSHPVGWVVGTSVGTRIGMPAAEGFAQVSCSAQGQFPGVAGHLCVAARDRRLPGWQATLSRETDQDRAHYQSMRSAMTRRSRLVSLR